MNVVILLQIAAVALLSPLLAGWIKWLKAHFQRRRGPSLLQPYRDLRKLVRKQSVRSDESSFVSAIAPYAVVGSVLTACGMLPIVLARPVGLVLGGSVFAFLLVMALGRCLTALLGLDSGSAFAGMAAGRDLLFALVAEPVALLAVLAVALPGVGATWTGLIPVHAVSAIASVPATVLAFAALVIVVVAETGRLPIDNPDTHLELTMVHEGMVLDTSGPALAALTWAAQMRQVLWFALLVDTCVPVGIASQSTLAALAVATAAFVLKLALLGAGIAGLETAMAKLRIFAVPRLLSFALALSVIALLVDVVT